MNRNKILILPGLLIATLACAQDYGTVISSTPVVQQVGVPRQVCSTQQIEVQRPNSGTGAALGAITGAVIGGATGHGREAAAASVVGAIGGAVVGNALEGTPPPQERTIQNCYTQTAYENRVVAYNVVYEFSGKKYSVQMPNDPGPTIALQVVPAGSTPAYNTQVVNPPVVSNPQPVIVQQVEPVYYVRPYYPPPVQLEFGFGFPFYWGHHRWH